MQKRPVHGISKQFSLTPNRWTSVISIRKGHVEITYLNVFVKPGYQCLGLGWGGGGGS